MVDFASIGGGASPRIRTYDFDAATGYGTAYADPATVPGSSRRDVTFSKANDLVATCGASVPKMATYPWSTGVGYGAKFAEPATVPTDDPQTVDFTEAGDALGTTDFASPFVHAWAFSGAGFGAKFGNPATLPASFSNGFGFSTGDDAAAVGHEDSPRITAWPWSGAGFGAKFGNPGTLPPNTGQRLDFNTADDYLSLGHSDSPFITTWAWSGAGFGAKVANPGSLPPALGREVQFTVADDAVVLSHNTSPFVTGWPWAAGYGAKFGNPASLPGSSGSSLDISFDDDAVVVGLASSPFLAGYPFNSTTGYGTKYSDPATASIGGSGVAFNSATGPPPTIPFEPIPDAILAAAVQAEQEAGLQVILTSNRQDFELVGPTSIPDITGVTIEVIGGDCDHDSRQLPGLQVCWDQVTPIPGTSFMQYEIRRRVPGVDTNYTTIAEVTDISTTCYDDFCVASGTTYEYSIRWRVTAGPWQVVSGDQDPGVFDKVDFDFLFVHLEQDATRFVRFDTLRANKVRTRTQRRLQVWGRTAPTVAIGEQIWHEITVPGLEQALGPSDGLSWARLQDVQDGERDIPSVLCVRFGRAREIYFCQSVDIVQRQGQKSYRPELRLVEVEHDIEV